MDTSTSAPQTSTYPALGTRIKIKRALYHHQAFLPEGCMGCVTYVNKGSLIQVQFDQRIEDLALWKNTISYFNKQGRDALTWFHDECEVLQ